MFFQRWVDGLPSVGIFRQYSTIIIHVPLIQIYHPAGTCDPLLWAVKPEAFSVKWSINFFVLVRSYFTVFYLVTQVMLDHYSDVMMHRRLNCLFIRFFRRRPKKTSKLRVTGLCEGNSPVIGEFPTQRASNAENVSIWWRHHDWLTLDHLGMCM